ncbi:UDP-N-acetylmuramoyl-L-alanyl-D-glutamate--2,6-diaminopimelate ligase [bacterium]|nr:UDP-N-acetylmuramoyl-L-alanyl-D-glutamate--2,6-diaminopimelate ligase [bacterium]
MFKKILKKIIPFPLLLFYHYLLAIWGAIFYRFPSRKLSVIGVTGTNGKSTTVELITKILEEAGYAVASTSSIEFKIKEKVWPNKLKMTMPGRLALQRFLDKAVKEKCQYAVLEVTSEGIKLFRHKFIDFDIAVFTNLRPEHIESHGSFENYKKAKGKLFKAAKGVHIINLDDKNAEYFLQFPSRKKICYGIDYRLKTDWELKIRNWKFIKATDVKVFERGVSFTVDNVQFNLNLVGSFNVYNALAAICVGLSQNISLEVIKKALEKVKKMPGRMEEVISDPFRVVVDYAHTPDALEEVYKTLKNDQSSRINSTSTPPAALKRKNTTSKLICVLGACGGGRDRWKRPKLGEIAAAYCDKIILTNEDPYDEDPSQILFEIKSGISNDQFPISNLYEILDRRKAIRKAMELAEPGDIVIITGKGCEPWMCVAGGKKIAWDDRKIVKEEFEKIR